MDHPLDDLTICRCEGVKWGQIKTCIHHSGAGSINQIKKLTRAGMGPCQGHTCVKLIETILSAEAGIPPGTEPFRSRPPVRGLSIASLAATSDQYNEPAGPVSVVMTRTSDEASPVHSKLKDKNK